MSAWLQPEPANWWTLVEDAVEEDVGTVGDLSGGCLDPTLVVDWFIEAQGDGVLAGAGVAEYLLGPIPNDSDAISIEVHKIDGDRVQRGDRIMEGSLPAKRALMAERTSLNFLMHLSGVASLTAQFVQKVDGTEARICDTRKTLPGLRSMQKYAVRCGGGSNHRMGLFDAVMIKDNHIVAVGSITDAVEKVRSYISHMTKIEVECRTLDEVKEAVECKVDAILLDNMDPFMMRDAVRMNGGSCLFEASGGISLETVRGVAQTGVNLISIGALTHSAISLPFHMELL